MTIHTTDTDPESMMVHLEDCKVSRSGQEAADQCRNCQKPKADRETVAKAQPDHRPSPSSTQTQQVLTVRVCPYCDRVYSDRGAYEASKHL
jgi:hypothetical protein